MTTVFQVLALVTILVASVFLVRGQGAKGQALRRILMLIFIIAAASSVFFPQGWTWMAQRLGIGRGADLLLYLTVLTFVGFMATTYRRFRLLEKDITELARKLALSQPVPPQPESNAAE